MTELRLTCSTFWVDVRLREIAMGPVVHERTTVSSFGDRRESACHAPCRPPAETRADLFEVSRALGHASITTTANVYAHWASSMAERSAERMGEILGG